MKARVDVPPEAKASTRATRGASKQRGKVAAGARNGSARRSETSGGAPDGRIGSELLDALRAARDGDFSVRLAAHQGDGVFGEIAAAFNEMAERNARMSGELVRVSRIIGREGRMTERASLPGAAGAWTETLESVNALIDDLVRPTTEVARVIVAVADGDLSQKMALKIAGQPVKGEFLRIGTTVNAMVDQLSSFADEVTRVAKEVGTDGKLGGQAKVKGVSGTWQDLTESVNLMAGNLTDQVRNIAHVATAVARGDLSQKITVDAKGEVAALADTINSMTDTLRVFAEQVTGVAREVGTEGILGGQAEVEGVAGTWKDLTDSVNFMASNLTAQVRDIAQVTTAVATGDLSQKITADVKGEMLELKKTINTMVDQLSSFAAEVTRVAKEVGTDGKLGGQAEVKGVSGTWRGLTENVNLMAGNLTDQVRNIAQVATAVAGGDLSQKITVDARGEILELKDTLNTMVDQLSSFADEVTRVAKEVGTDGKLGGQAEVKGVSGTWRGLTENVNFMAGNLTDQVRNIALVTTAVAGGDLSKKITVDAKGEILELKETMNTMVDQLRAFAAEVTRVAKEVGTDGKLGGQAEVEGVSGTWRGLTENVNFMAGNLTDQVRNIALVTTAVAGGDLSKKITVEAKGEVAALADTINTMVDQLSSFADEVTRVAREVGTEGALGGQAQVEGVSGTWRGLTENVNFMASNLTDQVRNIAQVATAVANGDLSQKITVDAKGEIQELKDTINTMVDQLSSFADEVTRVAREVGTEGKLGGQAQVEGVSGTWKGLTDNVNQLAGNLTTQVRAIAEVSTAVTQGDLTRSIAVEAEGELAELKDNINQMIANLRDTTQRNEEQDWLKTNLAKVSGMMQGQRDLQAVSQLIMSELTPTVAAHHGAFYLAESEPADGPGDDLVLRLIASYGYKERKHLGNRFRPGEGLVGQAALERKTILLTHAPPDYIKISSGLGEAAPVNIIVMPIVFEEQVLGIIELGAFRPFSDVDQMFLDQVMETIGVVLNTIIANARTEGLLQQSQSLTQELQSQSEELQAQQEELKRSNSELESQARSLQASEELLQTQQEELQQTNEELHEKAELLGRQNRDIEVKNEEIERARQGVEDKAEQLALSSKYKSEFLANMSHELRTPLNSLLILSKLLADNVEANLSEKEVEFARTIHGAGSDLLALISDILDLSKVEAGKMDVHPTEVRVADLCATVERSFRAVAEEQDVALQVAVGPGTPAVVVTDDQRVQQVLKNLLSNAFKFTPEGDVRLRVDVAPSESCWDSRALTQADRVVAFSVADTGVGIPSHQLRLIFEAFQQADGTTSRKYGGTGLGLSISREIARLLGGEIDVRSVEGEGSTFTLYLPDRLTGGEASSPPPATATPAPPLRTTGPAPSGTICSPSALDPVQRDPALLEPGAVEDDRADIHQGDRLLLVIEDDVDFARIVRDAGREAGFKVLVALRGDAGLTLAHEHHPDGITLDLEMPGIDGLTVLDHLKAHPDTRHIPVHIVSALDKRGAALKAGALTYLEKPVTKQALDGAIGSIATFMERAVRHLLVVDDDEDARRSIAELVGAGDDVCITGAGSSDEALAALERQSFDCVVLGLGLPGTNGFALLETLKQDPRFHSLPVIVYAGKELTRQEETALRRYAETIIVKDVRSPERLLDETALFLHRVEANLPADKRRVLEQLHGADAVLRGKRILIVDDDVRNVFALTNALEVRGMDVIFAENGRAGLETLDANPDIDLVLMDIMMPEMDGYETTRAIRERPELRKLPIIALTAKAMPEDREKSIAAGASDYIPKPVEIDQLLSLMRVWLYR